MAFFCALNGLNSIVLTTSAAEMSFIDRELIQREEIKLLREVIDKFYRDQTRASEEDD